MKEELKDLEELKEHIASSKEDYLKWVKKLVDIDTDTGNITGSRVVSKIIIEFLEELGGKVEKKDNEEGVHLIARFFGDGEKKVLLYDHTDTVLPNAKNFHFRYDPNKEIGYGPGTSDSKGSVAFLLKFIFFLTKEKNKPYKELILYLDAQEETGSDLGDKLIISLSKEVDYAIVADGGRPGLGIVTRRKTLGKYSIIIEGIAGHAGNGAQSCASAMVQAARLIVALDNLASPSPGNPLDFTKDALNAKNIKDYGQFVPQNTINVGVLKQSEGAKVNIIPGFVELDLELRCFLQSEHERLEKEIFSLAKTPYKEGITITIEGGQEYKSVESQGAQKDLADLYSSLGKTLLNKEITHWQAGGVTPGNLIALYTPIIDGVGVDADPALEHTVNEELYVDSYILRMLLLLEFIKKADLL